MFKIGKLAAVLLLSASAIFADIPVEMHDLVDISDDTFLVSPRSCGALIRDASDYASAAYNKPESIVDRNRMAQAEQVFNFYATTQERDGQSAGFISYKVDELGRHKITIAFHGTECSSDWLTNLYAMKKSGESIGIDGNFHGGFLDRYLQSRDVIRSNIDSIMKNNSLGYDDVDFCVTGHSLGGALATLAAADIKKARPDASLDLVTFNSPRVADKAAAEIIDSLLEDHSIRLWRKNDIVSMVSLGTQLFFGYFTGFKHVGLSVALAAEESWNPLKHHSLSAMKRDAQSDEPVQILQHKGFWTQAADIAATIAEGVKSIAENITSGFQAAKSYWGGLFG
ncbi:MAG: hypothetical protein NTX76_00765 [Alphaproteobacteria bacterium]|nr:hypothetical protein [Alphaproteobacteria bacterium]